jgi:hypothetical protein
VRRDLPRRFVRHEVAALLLLFCVWPSVFCCCFWLLPLQVVVVLDSLITLRIIPLHTIPLHTIPLHTIPLHILHTRTHLTFSHSTAAPSAGCIILSCPPAHRAPCVVSLLLTHTLLLSCLTPTSFSLLPACAQ